jgi:hypothetical protein
MRGFIGLICSAPLAIVLSQGRAVGAPATLCKIDELVVFSCPTGKHIASICASKNTSLGHDAMQYRYGRIDKVELSYPDAGTKPADAFTSGTMMFSGGGGTWLRFDNGPFRYRIFKAVGKWGRNGALADAAGVVVEKDGKGFANFPCRAEARGEIGPDLLYKLGIKVAGPEQEFDIPPAFFPK